ncbi:Hint domain-containing protein [Paracoccus sp. IB05]|uniref:Hint domain-containing protein n=1 Tax=Paracoccus sp. IB05 TaxID=2779367 RepID=UPI0018E8A94A|nr:Hint domain-containing protein [Paracoccus sp. IB05]MBJ2150877.1 Hint domain-containing protein [Paracoccus sp. IB05]
MMIESLLSVETDLPAVEAAAASGLTVGTTVLTLDGALPVQFLAPGDRVITRSGAKILKSIKVSVMRDAGMIRVSASALGHDRPEADCFLAPGQRIILRDWRAKALYGQEVAMVEAQRLCDGDYIRSETVSEIRLFTLTFDGDEVIYANGMELLCAGARVTA